MTKGAKRVTSDEDTHIRFLVNGPDPMALSGPINGSNESRPGSGGPFPENLARAGHMGEEEGPPSSWTPVGIASTKHGRLPIGFRLLK